jgi:hypothetical protein
MTRAQCDCPCHDALGVDPCRLCACWLFSLVGIQEQLTKLTEERNTLRTALKEIARLRLATDDGSLRVRADRMWETARATLATGEDQ